MTGESEVRDGYTRLDNGFWADARICRLRDEMPRAALIYVMALSWCSCNLTDGDIDTDQLTYTLGASEQEIETLIDIGLFQQTITGVRINEYQSNGNHTRKELADRTARNTASKRRSRARQASDDKYSADFETFWKAYPRHVDKRPAWKASSTAPEPMPDRSRSKEPNPNTSNTRPHGSTRRGGKTNTTSDHPSPSAPIRP